MAAKWSYVFCLVTINTRTAPPQYKEKYIGWYFVNTMRKETSWWKVLWVRTFGMYAAKIPQFENGIG